MYVLSVQSKGSVQHYHVVSKPIKILHRKTHATQTQLELTVVTFSKGVVFCVSPKMASLKAEVAVLLMHRALRLR